MKRNTLANLLLLTSVAFFSACSTKTPKPEIKKEKVTVFDIIGLDVSKATPVVATSIPSPVPIFTPTPTPTPLPLAKTFPIEYPPIPSMNVCESYEPLYSQYTQPNTFQDRSFDPSLQVEVQDTFYDVYESSEYTQADTVAPVKVVNRPIRGCKPYRSRYSHVKDVESSAKQLLGIKYVWGATGPYKYDCSGFTQKIYRDAGINIPRVSRDQAKVGQYVSFNNLQKGDMVFFDTHKKKTGKVTHVGIYLGNGNFIHASSAAKKIVIFNFDKKKFYKKRFLWGRRVIQDVGLASL